MGEFNATTGMAIRIAYNLGLNHDCTAWVQQGKITEDEAEVRKITWWGCFLLDKYTANPLRIACANNLRIPGYSS